MLEDLDFSNLKLPIEPKNLIYLYLAYKLINNLDKLDLSNLGRRAPVAGMAGLGGLGGLGPMKTSFSNNFIFLVILIVGASFMFLNNILSKISVSSISVENLSTNNKCPSRRRGFLGGRCPMKRCPMFGNVDLESWKTQCPMSKCPVFQNKSKQTCQAEKKDRVETPVSENQETSTTSVPETSTGGEFS